MDSQTGWQLVAASNLHVEWSEGVLARTNGEFLAGRIHLAWQTTRFPSERRVLLDLFHARDWRGRGKSVSALNETECFSAGESLAGVFKLRCPGPVCCVSIDRLRLRALRVSVPCASIFHFRTTAQRCGGSIFLAFLSGVGLAAFGASS